MPSRRKTILLSESGVVSSFDKIIECAGYKLNLEMLIFPKPYLEAKYRNIIDYFRTYDLTNINVTLRDKSLIESFLMDLYNAGYDIKSCLNVFLNMIIGVKAIVFVVVLTTEICTKKLLNEKKSLILK
jgi:hypothetical protein|nr:MAG TPA: hypothetical protein [Herelleviridae sp.]